MTVRKRGVRVEESVPVDVRGDLGVEFFSNSMASADKEISYSDLKSLIEKEEGLVLVDVRSKPEVDKGRIPRSIHIPLEDVEHDLSLDPEAFYAKFGVHKPTQDAPHLVFHCQLGRRGGVATEKARKLGYQNACNYAGAYSEWAQKECQ